MRQHPPRPRAGTAELERRHGRLLLRSGAGEAQVRRVLERTFGIVGFSRALQVDKDPARLEAAALELAPGLAAAHGPRFKIEARRSDKSFALDSYGIACRLGALLRERIPGLVVDLHHPDWVLNVEIRERAYLYGPPSPTPGGLPVGSSGRGLLLLSGGIDSPVAGWLLAKRGLAVDAVHFHTPPYTSARGPARKCGSCAASSRITWGPCACSWCRSRPCSCASASGLPWSRAPC